MKKEEESKVIRADRAMQIEEITRRNISNTFESRFVGTTANIRRNNFEKNLDKHIDKSIATDSNDCIRKSSGINDLFKFSDLENSVNNLDSNYENYLEFCKIAAFKEPVKEYFSASFDEIETEYNQCIEEVCTKKEFTICNDDFVDYGYVYGENRLSLTEKSTESINGSIVTEYAVNQSYSFNSSNCSYVNNYNSAVYEQSDKPTESYAYMIYQALNNSREGKLTLAQIYEWIEINYSFYKTADPVWKNSIRHNLSLNQTFVKIPRPLNSKEKGGYWAIDQARCQFSVHKRNRRIRNDYEDVYNIEGRIMYPCK